MPPAPTASAEWFDRLALAALRAAGFRSRWLKAPSGPVHLVEAAGEGTLPPILLLHGLGSCTTDLAPLMIRLLPLHRRVLALDLPGHGHSAPPPPGRGAREIADTLFAALDGLPREPLLVFGNSLGGLVALLLAAARPERVRALMLASPAGAPMPAEELDRLLEQFRFPTHGRAVDFVERYLPANGPARHAVAWGLRRRFSREPVVELIGRVGGADLLTPQELGAIEAPVLLFWGREDRLLPVHHADFFRAHLRQVEVEAADGYGHAPFLDRPRAFVRRIEAFARAA